ncbi:DUF4231 domain-containing protein [Streptosporangium carneum]|uniref:Membrane protein n=1 Tax=Streptosporangium carneum TaxID=47481 RepID=A0A9W6IAX1_9ACTN|nr:DUF4231 domain-containing protein [Streptosporangium carneum]GLK15301.1 membrane protein [Streptosporangium carneum]
MLPESEFPALYRSADRTAIASQRRLLVATGVRLSSLITAALCGSFSAFVAELDVMATVAAAAMGVALVTEVYLLTTRPDRRWYEARAAAESAKTLAWRYLVGGEPFGLDGAEADGDPRHDHVSDRLLLRRFSKITSDLRSVAPVSLTDGDTQVTEGMRTIRALPLDERKRHYMVGRLDDQRAWYAAKANLHERRAAMWLVMVATAEALGLVTAAVKAALGKKAPDIDLPGVLGAVAAGGVAWLQTRQHQQVASAYAIAALELGDIVVRAAWPTTEAEWAHFVDEAEEAISREHMLWTASHA